MKPEIATHTPWICTLHEEGICDGKQHGDTHTPTPWKLGRGNRPGMIVDATGMPVVEVPVELGPTIVRAVNCHEELLTNLTLAAQEAEAWSKKTKGAVSIAWSMSASQYRKALAKAGAV